LESQPFNSSYFLEIALTINHTAGYRVIQRAKQLKLQTHPRIFGTVKYGTIWALIETSVLEFDNVEFVS